MISDAAFAALLQETQRRGFKDGVLGEALLLYQKNHDDLHTSNPALTPAELERTLLLPTAIMGVVTAADRGFRENAVKSTRLDRAKAGAANAGWNILLGIVTNFLFLVMMIAIYLSAQDTAQSFFASLGVRLVPEQASTVATVDGKRNGSGVLDTPNPALLTPPNTGAPSGLRDSLRKPEGQSGR